MYKPKALTSLSLFFPCYNESANVGQMIEQSVKVGEEYGIDYEVIVVDDGSRDNSAQIVQQWMKKNPRVKLIQHEKNKGYGAALRTGLKSASKDLVFLTDGDNQFHVSDIEKLFSMIDSADVVTGYRVQRKDGLLRFIKGKSWTFLNKALFGVPVRDVDCAFKLFRRRTIDAIPIKSNYLLIHSELLARMKRKGFKIREIGVTHYPRPAGKATATSLGSVLKTFREMFLLSWDIRSGK